MGFSVMLWGAEKLVPAEYWCPYGTMFEMSLSNVFFLYFFTVYYIPLSCYFPFLFWCFLFPEMKDINAIRTTNIT